MQNSYVLLAFLLITIALLIAVSIYYFTIYYLNGYFEEINKIKYLTLVPTNESKENIKKI